MPDTADGDALPGLEPLPPYTPRPTYVGQIEPVPAPPVEWAAVQWVTGARPAGADRRWRTRSETHAINLAGTAAMHLDELTAMVATGEATVIEVAILPALVREALALRATAVYRLGYHEEGDECDDYDGKTGECPCVRSYVATAADARLRYEVAALLDQHTQRDPDDLDNLDDLRDLVAGLKRALASDFDD